MKFYWTQLTPNTSINRAAVTEIIGSESFTATDVHREIFERERSSMSAMTISNIPEIIKETQAITPRSPYQVTTEDPSSLKVFDFDDSHAPLALLGNVLSFIGFIIVSECSFFGRLRFKIRIFSYAFYLLLHKNNFSNEI